MPQPGGYIGKNLFIDLGSGQYQFETADEAMLRDFIGGYGIGARVVYEKSPAGLDAFHPDSMLGFVTGPLTGTSAIMGSRYVVVGKSPLTGSWGDANSGGEFGPYLKFAGYDAVYFTGQAAEPVYLLVHRGDIKILPADDIWGLDTVLTQQVLHARHGYDAKISCIGPAGERLVRIAAIMNDGGRAAARSGLGAVMGGKRLKAIVVRGSQRPLEAEPERMKALREKYLARFKENPFAPILKKYGTSGAFKALMELGRTPIKNFGGSFPDDFPNPDNLDGPAVLATQIKKYGCWRCNQGCGGIVRGSSVDPEGTSKKPEYESLGALGSYCQIDDLDTVTQLTDMCNRSGLDSISAGAVISFAMECFENGLIRAEQLDGLSLHWGKGQAARALLQMIIDRRGLGELLGEGVMRAAREIGGSEQFAMHAGGQELAVHDPRQDKDFGLSYQISPTPGRHTQGGVDFVSLSEDQRKIYGLDTKLEQVDPVRFHAEAYAKGTAIINVVNAAGLCMYGFDPMGPEAVVEFLSAVTGWKMDMAECLTTGERIEMMRYLFCLREGYDFVNARVAPRALGNPPLAAGPTAGVSVDMSAVRTAYLEYLGMDALTGIPGIDRLKSLGLDAFFPVKQAEFLEGKS